MDISKVADMGTYILFNKRLNRILSGKGNAAIIEGTKEVKKATI